jgi:glycosyltransferase involved in cell wall biosynthesis
MRILVASAFEAGSQWAHAINTVKMAQGFARLGHKVTIVCRQPLTGSVPPDRLAEVYGLTERLHWIQLPNTILSQPIGEHWKFALLALPAIFLVRPHMVFTRNYIFPYITSRFGIVTVAESHAHIDNKTEPFLRLVKATRHRAFRLWVTISQRLAAHYQSLGAPKEKLAVLPDAVDLSQFQQPEHLPLSPYSDRGPHILYSGHLYDYKGIPTILEAAKLLPNINFHLLGGWPEDIAKQQQKAQQLGLNNLTFHGLKPHSAVPPYLWHASVLLLTHSQHHPSAAWTSPVKLAEYLASGTPVIASDIPGLRDWVTHNEVEFVPPDDPEALAEAIKHLLSDKSRAEQLREGGLRKAQELSYERRATAILQRCGFSC